MTQQKNTVAYDPYEERIVEEEGYFTFPGAKRRWESRREAEMAMTLPARKRAWRENARGVFSRFGMEVPIHDSENSYESGGSIFRIRDLEAVEFWPSTWMGTAPVSTVLQMLDNNSGWVLYKLCVRNTTPVAAVRADGEILRFENQRGVRHESVSLDFAKRWTAGVAGRLR